MSKTAESPEDAADQIAAERMRSRAVVKRMRRLADHLDNDARLLRHWADLLDITEVDRG